jgi:hypothetical protein
MNGNLALTIFVHGVFGSSSAYFKTVLNPLERYVRQMANHSMHTHYDWLLTTRESDTVWSVICAAFPLGECACDTCTYTCTSGYAGGTVLAHALASRIGRRDSVMLVYNALVALGAVGMYTSIVLVSIELMVVSRFVCGASR